MDIKFVLACYWNLQDLYVWYPFSFLIWDICVRLSFVSLFMDLSSFPPGAVLISLHFLLCFPVFYFFDFALCYSFPSTSFGFDFVFSVYFLRSLIWDPPPFFAILTFQVYIVRLCKYIVGFWVYPPSYDSKTCLLVGCNWDCILGWHNIHKLSEQEWQKLGICDLILGHMKAVLKY